MSNLKEATPTPEAKLPGSVNPETGAVQQADTAGAYLRASLVRIKGGETGILPVVGGLLLVSILFQSLNNHFLTAGNLVNLLVQAAVFSLLGDGRGLRPPPRRDRPVRRIRGRPERSGHG